MRQILLLLLLVSTASVSAQKFTIQIAAFADSVSRKEFTDRGLEDVQVIHQPGGLWQYRFGSYETREQAESVVPQLDDRGYKKCVILDLEVAAALSEGNCGYTSGRIRPKDDESGPNPVRTIFFDRGQVILDNEDRAKLDQIYANMIANPQKELRIMGFTDNVGTAEENMETAATRAKNVRNYFINKGIKAIRLFVESYGESEPLYENRDANGVEIPENQRWNNRVMMKYKE